MIYPIVLYGSPILRKRAKEIEKNYEGLDSLIEEMYETMYVSDGIGLAAPQIGKSLRIFVIDATEMAEEDPSLKGFKRAFINPRIIGETGDDCNYNEGCLSLPKIREEVVRKSRVRIQYNDKDFNLRDETYDGVVARIIQHEYDHLDGVLFIDRISSLRRKLLKSKLNAIARGKVDIDYKHVVMR